MKILRNKYNPNAPKVIISAEQIRESFEKMSKITESRLFKNNKKNEFEI